MFSTKSLIGELSDSHVDLAGVFCSDIGNGCEAGAGHNLPGLTVRRGGYVGFVKKS
jgi:hypothetical protein